MKPTTKYKTVELGILIHPSSGHYKVQMTRNAQKWHKTFDTINEARRWKDELISRMPKAKCGRKNGSQKSMERTPPPTINANTIRIAKEMAESRRRATLIL